MKKLLSGVFLIAMSVCATAQPNLVAHWDFDGPNVDIVNGTVTESLNGWVGTIHGNVGQSPGQALNNNTALWFGSSNAGYVQVPYDPAMDLQSWTISAVIRMSDCNSYINQFCQTSGIVWKGDIGSSNHYSLVFGDNPFDNDCDTQTCYYSVLSANAAGSMPLAAGMSYPDQAWLGYPSPNVQPSILSTGLFHCVTASYDGNAGIIRLYIDGVKYVEAPWQNQYGVSSPADLFIGNSNQTQYPIIPPLPGGQPAWYHQLIAIIDDIKIYDGVFADADVAGICNRCAQASLVAHWDFNNGNTTDLVNGWAGTVNGSPAIDAGFDGDPTGALKFHSGDYIQVPSDPAMNLSSWTIEARVRFDNFYNGACQANSILWHGTQWTGDFYALWAFDNPFDNSCSVYTPTNEVFGGAAAGNLGVTNNSYWLGTSPAPAPQNPFINPGQWYCIVESYDAAAEMINLYVDGVHVVSEPWANQYAYVPGSVSDLFIGATNFMSPGNYFPYFFDGAIDELKLYRGVFQCDEDILALCCDDQPIAHWDFNNGNTNDVGPNSWPCTPNGTLVPVQGISGAPNEAVHFNSGDFIQVPYQSAMNLKSWSITAVVRPTQANSNICQTGSILWRGAQFSTQHYALWMFDNPFNIANTPPGTNACLEPLGPNVFFGSAPDNPTNPTDFWCAPLNPGNPFIILGDWYCVTVTYNGADRTMRLYINGNTVPAVTEIWPIAVGAPTTDDLFIGSSNLGAAAPGTNFQYFFDGDIDDLQLFDHVLCSIPQCERGEGEGHRNASRIETISKPDIEIIPNPANDIVTVKLPKEWKMAQFTLTTITGTVVNTGTIDKQTSINTQKLPSGLYIISVKQGNNSVSKKLLIQH